MRSAKKIGIETSLELPKFVQFTQNVMIVGKGGCCKLKVIMQAEKKKVQCASKHTFTIFGRTP